MAHFHDSIRRRDSEYKSVDSAGALQPAAAARSRRGTPVMRFLKRHWISYLFVLPAVVFLVGLLLIPIVNVIVDSFFNVNLLRPDANGFVGLDNFVRAVSEPLFWSNVWNGVVWTVGSVFGEFVVGLATALLLNQQVRGRALFRAIMITPWVVPIVVAAMTWSWILNGEYGILNAILRELGIISDNVSWLGNKWTAMLAVINTNVWRSFPFWTLSYLAVLQTIDRAELEAAELDGANALQRLWYIVLPKLKGITLILSILNVIWVFNNFDFIWLMTQGGPLNATETLAIQTYLLAFEQYRFGEASAVAVIMLLMLLVAIGLYFYIQRRRARRIDAYTANKG
ncbi:carbohydrate ABC transporter permease [Kushneria aurantia]|uniref:Carbohydrate ABC transporter permease n=1 Tax=Kushneria aurantia TaxID=504092 RepID=A0ABV6FZ56_9GAMM|nr:sugar ABC transporter permease [Kushneria aurantia]